MRIGEMAAQAGVAPQTIRFYERRGLLPEPERHSNGYRDYDLEALALLRFVRSGQAAGLTLAEIASVLDLRREGAAPCTHVQSVLRMKLDEVRERQRELVALEQELVDLIDRSHRLDPADCSDAQICHVIPPYDES